MRGKRAVVGIVIVAIVAAALWWRRGGSEPTPLHRARPRSTITSTLETAAVHAGAGASRAAGWRDADPDGALRLEGQVLDPDGKGIGGAQITLRAAVPRSTVSDTDGSFAFDRLLAGPYELLATSGDLMGGPVAYRLTDHSDPVVIRLAEASAVMVTVVDEARHPIPGAVVHLGTQAERTFTTSAQGVARVAPIQSGWLAAEVSAAGFAPVLVSSAVGVPGRPGELTVVLHRGVPVTGRVVDEAGQPIAGVQVTPITGSYDRQREAAAITDERGEFVIAALAPGAYWLSAVDGEHEPARSPRLVVAGVPVRPVAIVMRSGGVVTGVVLDLARHRVPSARVWILAPTSQVTSWRHATADREGRFELRGLVRDRLSARADAAGARSEPIAIDLVAHAQVDVEIVLDDVATITGLVVDDQGAPVAEVQVMAQSPQPGVMDSPLVVVTRGDGQFLMSALADGAYQLSVVRHPGGPMVLGAAPGAGTLAHSGDTGVRLTIPAASTVVGRVVVAGSSAAPRELMGMLGGQPFSAGSDGALRITDASPGTWELFLHSPDFADYRRAGIKVERGTTDLGTIVVPQGRTLIGHVVDAAGAPVAGAMVRVDPSGGPPGPAGASSEERDAVMPIRSAETDRNGAFTVYGLPTSATQVTAHDPARGTSRAVEMVAGTEDPPAVTLKLSPI